MRGRLSPPALPDCALEGPMVARFLLPLSSSDDVHPPNRAIAGARPRLPSRYPCRLGRRHHDGRAAPRNLLTRELRGRIILATPSKEYTMSRLILVLLFGLALTPLAAHAQSVTLDVCDTGTIDVDVFVSRAGSVSNSHIRPSTCVAVAKTAGGGMQPAYLGLAFTDSRGQWGAARRFDRVPSMGVRGLPLATRLAMSARSEPLPRSPEILTGANSNATVRHGNANVSLPLQLLFQPPNPECRTVPTGNSSTSTVGGRQTTTVEVTNSCEDVVYTLTVEPYADSREASLGRLDTGGFFSDGPLGTTIIHENSEVNWAEVAAERKLRDAPQPVRWNDLVTALKRAESGERLSSGERFALPPYVTVRGTVSAVEIRQHPVDANTSIPVAEINFRESPPTAGRQYPEFNVCTERLDILQDLFGADFRTGMIGKPIEVQGRADGLCWGQLGEIQIYLARQVRPVQSAQFDASTRAWVPPAPYLPARPAPTRADVDAAVAEGAKAAAYFIQSQAGSRLRAACVEQSDKARAANPGNQETINQEYFACMRRVDADAQKEGQKADGCARELLKDNPQRMGRDPEGFYKALEVCLQSH